MATEVLKFFASWCGPCHQVAPAIKEAARDAGVPVTDINIEVDDKTPTQYKVRALPTVIILKDGVETERLIGKKTIGEYRAAFSR